MGRVFVVFCIDTEGPFTDPNYQFPSQLIGNWKDIDRIFLSKVFSDKFRYSFPDSNNNPAVFTWFMLNWTGFRTNPIQHDFGYHKVYDHYLKTWGKEIKKYGDEIGWHYHHASISGIGNEWGTDWFTNREYENQLCRFIIDCNFFPITYRAGGTIEDTDQSNWLEQWIPYDYSNRNGDHINWKKIEADGSKLIDILPWHKAPNSWVPYHPSNADLTKPGDMKRLVVRSLDIKSNVNIITEEEIAKAFADAKKGSDIILSLFDHDFRDREQDFTKVMEWISKYSKKEKIKFFYKSGKDAIKQFQNISSIKPLKLNIKKSNEKINIKTNKTLFNKQPFLAIKYSKNIYSWKPLFKISEDTWEYKLLPEDKNKNFGVAAHDLEGNTYTKVFKMI
ncbi:MAG: hypothetical protein PHQ59_02745 [Candidatus Daviesbacteria bacterium]|nr:hypothetical protein [Candidatus Daviesbacteria bacterium]